MSATTTIPRLDRFPILHRVAGFALSATLLLGMAGRNSFRGEVVLEFESPPPPSLLRPSSHQRSRAFAPPDDERRLGENGVDAPLGPVPAGGGGGPYYVFLQKFPLESTFRMLFHTEVVVCPRSTFSKDPAFLDALDGMIASLAPSRFDDEGGGGAARDVASNAAAGEGASAALPYVEVSKEMWSRQNEPGCVELGYGGANCGSACCGSPHRHEQRNYALGSTEAVIGNAMSEYKELYLYGVSGGGGSVGRSSNGIGGEEAYEAVCHGHMNAVEMGSGMPKCVSDWAGRDYNPLTNNCNTYTSAVLKCVYGLSDKKPGLGVSDMRTVTCPVAIKKKEGDGTTGAGEERCDIPTVDWDGEDEVDAVLSPA